MFGFLPSKFILVNLARLAQGFTLEILLSLQSVVELLDTNKLILFPQIFWAAIAMLESNYHYEFLQAVSLLSELVERIDFDDDSVRAVLLSKLPEKWTPNFFGWQPRLFKGLVYSKTEPQTMNLINKLHEIRFDQLVDPSQGRLLFAVLATLPSILATSETGDDDLELSIAFNIAAIAERKGQEGICRWFKSKPAGFSKFKKMGQIDSPFFYSPDISKKRQNVEKNIKPVCHPLSPDFLSFFKCLINPKSSSSPFCS